ncbi:nrap protein [Biscogniauxia marginata]|nr:nrap protein [Biscogniauxia marginata]
MEENNTKRRKLSHTDGVSPLEDPSAPSVSGMGASGASAFVLETEELLRNQRLDYNKSFAGLDDTLRQFKDAVEALEGHAPLPIGNVTSSFEKSNRITIPYPEPKPKKDSALKLSFAKPAQVNVVGSYFLKTMTRSQTDFTIDMIIVMPASLFQEKDYLNFRYFQRRAYYLAYVAAGLRKSFASAVDFTFDLLNGNPLLPVLIARPKDKPNKDDSSSNADSHHKLSGGYRIRLILNAPEGFFPVAKLSASSNAIRQGKSEESEQAKTPTPFYNTTLKAESTFSAYLKLLHRATSSCSSFRDACTLGRIWLSQRGFGGDLAEGGFGHFEWAVLMALLLQGGGRKGEALLSPALHSTQLFKATLQYLVSVNLHKKPVVLGGKVADLETIRQSGPILYDAARGINILFKMTSWSAAALTEQAKWSLAAIKDNPLNQFDSLFIVKASQPLQIYDLLLKIKTPASKEGIDVTDCRGYVFTYCDAVYRILKKALGERAEFIHIEVPKTTAWPVSGTPLKARNDDVIIGVIVDPVKAAQGREFGPAYEQKKEATKFREFWGEKADLWQFPDGQIKESLDWTEYASLGYSGISEAIIRYILKLQLGVSDGNIEFYGREPPKGIDLLSTDSTAFDSVRKAFQTFDRDIRDLEDLPLHVRKIDPIAPELRQASLHAPDFNSTKQLSKPMEVCVSFEASGKWPDNIAAIQRLKIALLLKVGSSLEESKDEIKTHIGLESTDRDTENLAFLDVVYENGVTFRLRVSSDQEETLLDRLTKDKTAERHIRTEAADLLAAFKLTYAVLPLHNQTISTFCSRFPALSPSIRMVKQWFNSHKLSHYFNDALIELFVLQAFLTPFPWPTPTCAVTGLLRTLQLLSRWDWRDEPLVVDSSNSLSSSQRLEINTRLDAWRKLDPNMNRMVLFVATSHETSGVAYTRDGPPKVVTTRMTTLARSASKLVKDKGVDLDIRTLFHSPLRDYDVLIHLAPKVLKAIQRGNDGTKMTKKHSQFKNLGLSLLRDTGDAPPLVEHPSRALLKRLEAAFDAPLLFFHGGEDDRVIAALWNPQLHRRGFAAHMPCSFRPASSGEDGEGGREELFEVNKEAVLAEIARIGGEVIERIEVK